MCTRNGQEESNFVSFTISTKASKDLVRGDLKCCSMSLIVFTIFVVAETTKYLQADRETRSRTEVHLLFTLIH